MALSLQGILRRKRDGETLGEDEIRHFVECIARRCVDPAQIGAFAMAARLRGMDADETLALTLAMRDSGRVLRWKADGPVVDKHSTGGVGDCTSLLIAPMLAACGARVPMISGRGLGHTGGTLDKLESIPGYRVQPGLRQLRQVVDRVRCAIVGAGATLAPADRRLYAVRDVTATVDSIPLITASILSKKLAEGLDALVLDVKTGNGAICADADQARALARSLHDIATRAGLSTRVLLTDMEQPLATAAGNALELRAVISILRGASTEPRLRALSVELAAVALCAGGLADDVESARDRLHRSLDSGDAAERFAAMVVALGGPGGLLDTPDRYLDDAPCKLAVCAARDGLVQSWNTRALGEIVVQLGGGRERADQSIDHRVGLSGIAEVGEHRRAGEPLAWVHADDATAAEAAVDAVLAACRVGDTAALPRPLWQTLEQEV